MAFDLCKVTVITAAAMFGLGGARTASAANVFEMGSGLNSLEFVTVGDAGNADNAAGVGGVAYEYRISKYEVTNAQYAAFLSAVEPQNTKGLYEAAMTSDPRGGIVRTGSPTHAEGGATEANRYMYAAKPGMENLPVTFISKPRAAQFVNWLHNGQPTVAAANGWIVSRDNSITFSGAYQMAAWNSALAPRLEGAQYFLPSEDEWVKAAFYQPTITGGDVDGYWDYATGGNIAPTAATVDANGNVTNAGANTANYNLAADWGVGAGDVPLDGNKVAVGSAGSSSHYGAFDMAGNVWELTQDFVGSNTVVTGGSWEETDLSAASYRTLAYAQFPVNNEVGFRVAALVPVVAVPEPAALSLLAVGALAALRRRRRHAAV